MKKENHTHKLKRIRYKNHTHAYICTLDCTFKASPENLEGRLSICNRCNKEFKLTTYSLTLKFPHCSACHGKPLSIFAQHELAQIVITHKGPFRPLNLDSIERPKTARIEGSVEEVILDKPLIDDEGLEKVEFKTTGFSNLRSRISAKPIEETQDDIL